jgi:hypothetical protein
MKIQRITTSCPCLRVVVPREPLLPGQTVPLKLVFDPGEEPDFRGSLSMTFTGYADEERPLFDARVEVHVEVGTGSVTQEDRRNGEGEIERGS